MIALAEPVLRHRMALSFAGALALAALACAVHALLPFLFEKTGSRAVERLYERMVSHRDMRNCAANDSAALPVRRQKA